MSATEKVSSTLTLQISCAIIDPGVKVKRRDGSEALVEGISAVFTWSPGDGSPRRFGSSSVGRNILKNGDLGAIKRTIYWSTLDENGRQELTKLESRLDELAAAEFARAHALNFGGAK